MVFSSIAFLCYFLPISLILYFISPNRLKNAVLFAVSLFFYAWGEPKFLPVMLFTIAQGYVFGILIEKSDGKVKKCCFVISIALSLGSLLYYKYADFLIESVKALGLSIPKTGTRLPIGISFYTFQILSYTVDIYRGKVSAQRNFINLGAYVAMFPQLIAGPIVRYGKISEQIESRSHSISLCASGTRRFVLGLGKKVLIANVLGEIAKICLNSEKSVLFLWLYAVSVMLSIYFDFSGYSDMAIGLGRIFGFDFDENFNYPYISKSISEFWRRWHMSLGSFFRDYVYIPLGGSRVGRGRFFLNVFIVWLLTGLWHGAAWNFALWGLYFGVLICAERAIPEKVLDKFPILRRAAVLILLAVSFVIFDADSLASAAECIKGMFGFGGIAIVNDAAMYYLKSYGAVLIIGIFGACPTAAKTMEKLRENSKTDNILCIVEPIALAAIIVVCLGYIVDGSFNPFLYFRF